MLASRVLQEGFGFVKRNLSEAQRRKDAASGERGAHSEPEREQRSDSLLFRLSGRSSAYCGQPRSSSVVAE